MNHPDVVIVDFGAGNLYNVERALAHVGLRAHTTSSPAEVLAARAVVLPGVGAMRDAMRALDESGVSDALRTVAERGTPLLGVCLGMQLLMDEGTEFGHHAGLGIVPGSVTRFPSDRGLKVPHIGWNAVYRAPAPDDPWAGTPLEGMPATVYQYFVHSFRVQPADPSDAVGLTRYGDTEFCSFLHRDNVFGCQFHPERSGPLGLKLYEWFARRLTGR